MAPALTSNSFRVTAGAYSKSKPDPRPPSKATAVVCANKNPFGIGKRKDSSSSSNDQPQPEGSNNKFFFDFGNAKSLIPVVSTPSTSLFANRRRKDPRTVFVAGATGQSGVRIAQTLLRQGFAVRAGVPDLTSAQELARLAAAYKIISPEESKRLNAVESTFVDAESIAKAIGPAAKVVVTIGPGENGPTAEVTTDDALQVIRAAQLAGVGHVAVVYNSGPSGPLGGASTYNVLDGVTSFFSNLFTKSQTLTLLEFLSKLVETDVSYTLIKAALIDDYSQESSNGLVVSEEGSATAAQTPYGSKVSKSQIATLVADVFSNTSVAENKVVEVCASPSASSKSIVELFSAIPEDGRRKAYAEALAREKAEEEALLASDKAREAAEVAQKFEEEVKKLSEQKARAAGLAEEAQERAEAVGSSLENLLSRAKNFSGEFSWGNLSSQIATAVSQKPDDEPGTQIATIRGQTKARNLPRQKAVIKKASPKSKPQQPEPKPEVRNVFGGLFKQETIYIDDD